MALHGVGHDFRAAFRVSLPSASVVSKVKEVAELRVSHVLQRVEQGDPAGPDRSGSGSQSDVAGGGGRVRPVHVEGMCGYSGWGLYACFYCFGACLPLTPPQGVIESASSSELDEDTVLDSADLSSLSSSRDADSGSGWDSDLGSVSHSMSGASRLAALCRVLQESDVVMLVDDALPSLDVLNNNINQGGDVTVIARLLYLRARLLLRAGLEDSADGTVDTDTWIEVMGGALGDAMAAIQLGYVVAFHVAARIHAELNDLAVALKNIKTMLHWLPKSNLEKARAAHANSDNDAPPDAAAAISNHAVVDDVSKLDSLSLVVILLRARTEFIRAIVFNQLGDVAAAIQVLRTVQKELVATYRKLKGEEVLASFVRASARNLDAARTLLTKQLPSTDYVYETRIDVSSSSESLASSTSESGDSSDASSDASSDSSLDSSSDSGSGSGGSGSGGSGSGGSGSGGSGSDGRY